VGLADLRPVGTGAELTPPDFTAREEVELRPEQVALRVDGWVIAVEGLDASKPEAAAPRPIARVRVARRPTVSRYEHLIRWHAASHGFDWRLVEALIHEESRFRADAVSTKGAVGLMQVREIAAADVGETRFHEPDDNIRTGVRYLKRLDAMFPAAYGRDRLALVLAAYNAGPAHVQDAQVLARAYGFDPHRWEGSMARMIPLLEDPTFHRRLPAGYAQGRAVVTYVERILARYERAKAEDGEAPGLAVPARQAASANG
jgi:membrane-bound lytic murein transglycosylase F